MNQEQLHEILEKHNKWLDDKEGGRKANLYGANLHRANLFGADLRGANLRFCKGVMSFTGEKHLLIYFKTSDDYFFKIGCITKTAKEWFNEFKSIGGEHHYGSSVDIYGDVIKLFSQYDLLEKDKEWRGNENN